MTKKEVSFESLLEELETVVNEIESGELSLDVSIKKFEKALEHYNQCKQYLEKAQQKITILSDSLKEENYQE